MAKHPIKQAPNGFALAHSAALGKYIPLREDMLRDGTIDYERFTRKWTNPHGIEIDSTVMFSKRADAIRFLEVVAQATSLEEKVQAQLEEVVARQYGPGATIIAWDLDDLVNPHDASDSIPSYMVLIVLPNGRKVEAHFIPSLGGAGGLIEQQTAQ